MRVSGEKIDMTQKNERTLVIIPGDGIGPEIIGQASRVVEWFDRHRGLGLDIKERQLGVNVYEKHGTLLQDETLETIQAADATLFGAIGGDGYDEIPREIRVETGLLSVRRKLAMFANIRPVVAFDALVNATSLKPEVVRGTNMIILRELNGGLYFGEPRGVEEIGDGNRRGVNSMVYTTPEIRRVARVGFELAKQRGGHLTSVDKANALEVGQLWRDEVSKLGTEAYPDIPLNHLYVDNAMMQVVRDPKQFDVVVTENTFGDIMSDCAAAIAGSLGMLPSASLSDPDAEGNRQAFYEPIHGCAPDIAGQNIANPIGTILSFGMALRHTFNRPADADLLEEAVGNTLAAGTRTADIAADVTEIVSTTSMGDAILENLDRLAT
jgi:3-isopropylmalate dehydrogenase